MMKATQALAVAETMLTLNDKYQIAHMLIDIEHEAKDEGMQELLAGILQSHETKTTQTETAKETVLGGTVR